MILTLDARTGNYFPVVVTAAITEILIENGDDGQVISIVFQQDSVGHSVSAGGGNIQGFVTPSASANALSAGQFVLSQTNNTWIALQTAAGGSPAGTNTAVQFNNNGAFGGNANNFSYDDSTQSLQLENGGASTIISFVGGATQSMDVTLNATSSPPALTVDNTETDGTLFLHSDGNLTLESDSGAVIVQISGSGSLGFFGATGHVKEAITGSKASNAALASLLTALAAYGLVTDSTT